MPNPSNHLFEVEIALSGISADSTVDFILPAWRSGRYLIFNFSSGIQEFTSLNSAGKSLKWYKTDKSTWSVESEGENIINIKYKVYSNDFSMRTRGLNDEHGFIDASAVFMYPEKYRYNPIELNIQPYANWHVTTGLEKSPSYDNRFFSPHYDFLADCPLEIGTQKDYEFFVNGKEHTACFSGEGNYNADTVIKDLSEIIKVNYNFWGDLPYDNFTFIFHLTPHNYGGTEHFNSFVIDVPRFIFKKSEDYLGFLSTCSHEFFHTWNVKRLRPQALVPYNFKQENYTSELWIAEGTTSYYSDLLLLKAGYGGMEHIFSHFENKIENDINRPGNRIQSLMESSFDAWVKFWNNTQNKWIAESDYYSKGECVSMILDMEIRNSSGNKYSLDNVMRTMYEQFPLEKGGYTNADFIKVSERYAGKNLKDFFSRYLYGTDTIDWNKYLNYAGLKLVISVKQTKPSIGIYTDNNQGNLEVTYVLPGSGADDAGIVQGDEIIALNGFKVSEKSLESRISDLSEGEMVKLTIIRNEMLKDIDVEIKNHTDYNYKLEKAENPTALQKSIFESWLYLDPEK